MSLPYFPMYPTDFEAKTSHLTLEEDGAYNRLLRLMWMTPGCSLPDDDAWIMRRMRCSEDRDCEIVLAVIAEFFNRKGGRIVNSRLAKEWQKTDLAHRKRVSAGSMGGKAKALKTNNTEPSNATPMLKQPEPEPEPIEKEIQANASPKKVSKATRLPEDWRVPQTLGEWAVEEGMPPDVVRREAAKFRDYWRAQPGQKGVKLDWPATWRNWVRKWIESSQPKRVTQDDFWTGKVVS